MSQPNRYLTDAEKLISQQLDSYQRKATSICNGHEKEAIIALIRALDTSAVMRLQGVETPLASRMISLGAATALRPLLPKLANQPNGVPWGPTNPETAQFAQTYLKACGQLSHLSRMAALERYGLSTTAFISANHILIKVRYSIPELSLQLALSRRNSRILALTPENSLNETRRQLIVRRMKSYVDAPGGWFIRYENDEEIVSTYLERAKHYGKRFLEAEAFPHDVKIGDRSFGEWIHACDQALGRILCHIDFVSVLQRKRPKVNPSDVLTIYSRRDDLFEVWQESGLPTDQISSTMRALTLESGNLDDWENTYEVPCSFYVDLGKDHVLMPCFGALANPYFALFRHLRNAYKPDWDKGVDRREEIFRSEFATAFPEPDFLVPLHGFQLRRSDGSNLTDVDAIVVDRRHGTLVLIQLKWHDIFGFSLPERESRRRNISKANEWVERVVNWVDGRTSADLAKALGLNAMLSEAPPLLYVVARYAARFSGELKQDPRAFWLGWPEIMNVLDENPTGDVLALIPSLVLQQQAQLQGLEEKFVEYRFPDLAVDLHITQ